MKSERFFAIKCDGKDKYVVSAHDKAIKYDADIGFSIKFEKRGQANAFVAKHSLQGVTVIESKRWKLP